MFIRAYRVQGLGSRIQGLGFTHRPLSSSFLGLPYRILNKGHKKELLRGPMGRVLGRLTGLELLRVGFSVFLGLFRFSVQGIGVGA